MRSTQRIPFLYDIHHHRCDTAQRTSPTFVRSVLGNFFMLPDFDLGWLTERCDCCMAASTQNSFTNGHFFLNGLSDLAPQLCTSLIDWSSVLCGSDASVPSTTWNVSVSFRLLLSTSLGGQGGHFLFFDSPRSRCQSQESRAAQEHIKGQEQLARMFSFSPVQTIAFPSAVRDLASRLTFVCPTPFVLYPSCQFAPLR